MNFKTVQWTTLFLVIVVVCLAAFVCLGQRTSALVSKPVVLRGEHNSDPVFFTSERAFDLMCDIMDQGHFYGSDIKVFKKQLDQHVKVGTLALELSREIHYKKVQGSWIGKSKVRITSGPRVGQEGWVLCAWVFPSSTAAKRSLRQPKIVEGVLWDRRSQSTFMCKSYRVMELLVRGIAHEELTDTEKHAIANGSVLIDRPTSCNIISVTEGPTSSDGRSWGYAHIEVLDGPHKGLRGYTQDDQVKKK